jgi:hypothetical protein
VERQVNVEVQVKVQVKMNHKWATLSDQEGQSKASEVTRDRFKSFRSVLKVMRHFLLYDEGCKTRIASKKA